jgi:hypothetical protein
MSKKTMWWLMLILVGLTLSMAGVLRTAAVIEASQPGGDFLSILTDRYCSRSCEAESADPMPEPPPPPIISDRFCDRLCLEAAEETAEPIPEPPPPPVLSHHHHQMNSGAG